MPDGDEKICFVIAPIGDDESEIRKRSDQILKYIIKPVADDCGYETVRADKISEPGIITKQVIEHIIEDSLVIADLTGSNPNVFYELALRHAIRKPTVQMIAKGERMPFDIAGSRTIHVDHQDLDSVGECKDELAKQIKAVENDPSLVDNPIVSAVELQSLTESGNPLASSISEILAGVNYIRGILESEPVTLPTWPSGGISIGDSLVNDLLKGSSPLVPGGDLLRSTVADPTLPPQVEQEKE